MNPIQNVGGNQPVQKVSTTPIRKQLPTDAAAAKPSIQDRVELSGVGHLLGALRANDIRADKVASIKSQIEAGTYEDDKKLDAAVDRLLDDLSK
jgi:anti-sigma28 factor (negative regulator of flagellin synthesis)